VDQPHVAQGPGGHAVARLADQRVEAVGEGNGGHQPRLAGQDRQLLCLHQVGAQGLLADDVLPRAQGRGGIGQVGVVRRAHVHDVDVRIGGDVLRSGVRTRGAEFRSCLPGPLGRARADARQVSAGPAQGLDVQPADHSGPDHSGGDDGGAPLFTTRRKTAASSAKVGRLCSLTAEQPAR
jgi:hypothetical protein